MNYSSEYDRFRALLRKIREEAGLSQSALAARLGKPQTFVSKSELGERRIDFLETMDFCAGCNIPMDRFIERLAQAFTNYRESARPKRRSPRKMDDQERLNNQRGM